MGLGRLGPGAEPAAQRLASRCRSTGGQCVAGGLRVTLDRPVLVEPGSPQPRSGPVPESQPRSNERPTALIVSYLHNLTETRRGVVPSGGRSRGPCTQTTGSRIMPIGAGRTLRSIGGSHWCNELRITVDWDFHPRMPGEDDRMIWPRRRGKSVQVPTSPPSESASGSPAQGRQFPRRALTFLGVLLVLLMRSSWASDTFPPPHPSHPSLHFPP